MGLLFNLSLSDFSLLSPLLNELHLFLFTAFAGLHRLILTADVDESVTLEVQQERPDLVVDVLGGLR
jgi:hypothetical protein